jgi:ATP/maltotriose-dependent transcriptional regulator MalT/DNA-binding SARP family transcriptional activator
MSKVTRPILTGISRRKRLFQLLDRMRKQPVVWVSGPPGCGKTTLISSYLDARKLPCLWFQVDEGDGDPATFFYYMGQAAKKTSPRKRKPLPLLTPEYLQDIPTFTQRYFENLCGRLKVPSVLVFDNYHELPPNSPLHEIILNVLSRIPERINVILISRSEPPPVLIRLQANNLMSILGWDELRLTLAESAGLVQLRAKQKQSKEAIKHLHNMTDGWAAGLVLMLESIKRGIEPKLLRKLTPEEITDYFASVLFYKTDKEIQEFFLKTAFLPNMTAKMAEELTGLPNASGVLSILNRNNYFTEKRFLEEAVYQYHPLFREFLLSRAKEAFSPKELPVLLSRAAKLLEEDGQTESAVSLLRDSGDRDGMVRLITKHAPLMVAQGRYRPLEDWLSSLPMEIPESNPWLLYWMGSCRLPYNPSQSRPYFEKAFEKFRAEEDPPGLFLAWSGIVESITSDFEDYKPLDQWISVFEELMQRFKRFPSQEIALRVTTNMFMALLYRQPQHSEIEVWTEKALSLAEATSNIGEKLRTLNRLAQYLMFMGDFRKTMLVMNSSQQLAQSRDAPPVALILAKYVEAAYYSQIRMHEKCLKSVFDGLELSRTTGMHRADYGLLGAGVSSALMANEPIIAGKLLEEMASHLREQKPWMKCFYHLLRTQEALLRENPEEALLHAEMSLKLSIDVGSPLSSLYCHLAKAHVVNNLRKENEATRHLTAAVNIARQIKSKIFQFWVLLAKSLFALDQGEEAPALTSLREALGLGREGGYLNTFIYQPSTMVRLCEKALEAGIEVEYVQDLIRKRHLTPDKPPLHLENWPWPIKIVTLGRFELFKDGKPIQFSKKAQQKPLSMLKALIAFGRKEIREDQISDALWPEADGDMAHRSFKTTLHRLRQLIGDEKIIQLREGRLTLDGRYCWVDVWAFEHVLEEAGTHWKNGLMDRAVQLTKKSIQMYKGPFLGREIEQPWSVSISERLRSKFLDSVLKLGSYWQQDQQWEKAIECYQRGLEIDDLSEEFYQGLMNCYQHLGQKAKALSVYNRCKRVLSSTLGIEPSPKTEAIYKSLLA